ncbi:MAG TPA: hemerythrin domain-containing protein [Kofleriaceae bacterium]|nr:hemerythrin domain-containing protein [Kofleriaceae bacterium]
MNALELLKEQHDEVDELIGGIEKATDDKRKRQLFEEMADKLAAHATIEETIFYPAVLARQTEEILLESVEEHLSIKRVLADMIELDVDDDSFDAKLSVIKEQVTHHAREEEEGELFPKVKKLLSADELDGLGNEMLVRFLALLDESPRMTVPAETGEAAPI